MKSIINYVSDNIATGTILKAITKYGNAFDEKISHYYNDDEKTKMYLGHNSMPSVQKS